MIFTKTTRLKVFPRHGGPGRFLSYFPVLIPQREPRHSRAGRSNRDSWINSFFLKSLGVYLEFSKFLIIFGRPQK
jgi:hypothetical protein